MLDWLKKRQDSLPNSNQVQDFIRTLNQTLDEVQPIYDLAFQSVCSNPEFFGPLFSERPDILTFFSNQREPSTPYWISFSSELPENNSGDPQINLAFTFLNENYTGFSTATNEQLAADDGQKFADWAKRINRLSGLKNEVFSQYGQSNNNTFSLIPLEKFRYFIRELGALTRLKKQLTCWNQDNILDNVEDFQPRIQSFITAIQLFSAITAQLTIIFLKIQEHLSETQKIKKILTPNLGIQFSEVSNFTEEDCQRLIQEATIKLQHHQQVDDEIDNHIKEFIREKNQTLEQLIAQKEKFTPTSVNDVDRLINEENAQQEFSQGISLFEESFLAKLNELKREKENNQKLISDAKAEIEKIEEKIKNLRKMQENQQKKDSLEYQRNQALITAANTFSEKMPVVKNYLATYMNLHGAPTISPETIQFLASDLRLLNELSLDKNDEEKSLLKEMPSEILTFNLQTSGDDIRYENPQLFSSLVISEDNIPAIKDKTEEIIKKYQDIDGANESVLLQLDNFYTPTNDDNQPELKDNDNGWMQRFSSLSFCPTIVETESVSTEYSKQIRPFEEFALHWLIYKTTDDDRLKNIIASVYGSINLSANLPSHIDEWMDLHTQSVYFKFTNESSFNDAQLNVLCDRFWIIHLFVFIQTQKKGNSDQLRIFSIITVLSNMMKNLENIPRWIDEVVIKKITDSESESESESESVFSKTSKIKIAFSLILEFLCHVLSDKSFSSSNTVGALQRIKSNHGLHFTKEGMDTDDAIIMAIDFLNRYSETLLRGTNFEFQQPQLSSPSHESKEEKKFPASLNNFSKLFRRKSSSGPEKMPNHLDQKYEPIRVTEDFILLSPYTKIDDNSITDEMRALLFSFSSSNPEKEKKILNLLSPTYDKLKTLIPDTEEDEYRKKISAHNNQTTYVPTPQSPVYQNIKKCLKISESIRQVFYLIILKRVHQLPINSTHGDLDTFEKHIDQFFEGISSFWGDISRYLDDTSLGKQIDKFIFILEQLAILSRDILPSYIADKNVNQFLDKLSHFNAFLSIVCVLVLGLQREAGIQSNTNGWNEYTVIIKFLTEYCCNTTKPSPFSKKNIEKLRDHMCVINVALPLIKRECLIHWQEEHPNITHEEENYITNLLELNTRNMDIRLHLVYNELVISVLPIRELSGTYGLNIFPERLCPGFNITHAALDENNREPYSILKAGDRYLVKKRARLNLVPIKEEFVILLENIYSIVCDNTKRKNSLELIGFVFLFYFECVENTKIKSETGSDMAKALREFAVTEIGVDLGHYRTLFHDHIRPKAYRSHVTKKSEVEEGVQYDLFVLNLTLTAMVVKCAEKLAPHQLQFAIRANGYLSLLYIDTLIQNLNFPTPPESIFSELKTFNGTIRNNSKNYTDTDRISFTVGLTEFQKIKLSFIFVLIFYRELLAGIEFNGSKEYQDLFAHILKEYFLPDRHNDGTAYELAQFFFRKQSSQKYSAEQRAACLVQISRVDANEMMILRTIFPSL